MAVGERHGLQEQAGTVRQSADETVVKATVGSCSCLKRLSEYFLAKQDIAPKRCGNWLASLWTKKMYSPATDRAFRPLGAIQLKGVKYTLHERSKHG
jgi:hypothetical protein